MLFKDVKVLLKVPDTPMNHETKTDFCTKSLFTISLTEYLLLVCRAYIHVG